MGKFLIRSGQTIYTVINEALAVVNAAALSAAVFADNGFDELPDGGLLTGLTDPEVLYWGAGTEKMPVIYALAIGAPYVPQVVITEAFDMSDPSVIGIESITADASEDVLFGVSFDDGATWKAYEGNAWGSLDQTDSGMSGLQMQEISVDAWSQVQTSDHYRLRIVLPTLQSYFAYAVVTYLNP